MAVRQPSPPFLLLLLLTLPSLVLLSSARRSHTCQQEKFANEKVYTNCTNLRTLKSKLHWTFSPNNSTLSIAFIAPPEKPEGWIAWAINPTRRGMAGSQALMAFKNSEGAMTVKTYNISSYHSMKEGKIAFQVLESSAEYSNGVMKIFATLKLPKEMMTLNQVWQVGDMVSGGKPKMHGFLTENKSSMEILRLREGVSSNDTGNTTRSHCTKGNHCTSLSPIGAETCGVFILIGWLLGFF